MCSTINDNDMIFNNQSNFMREFKSVTDTKDQTLRFVKLKEKFSKQMEILPHPIPPRIQMQGWFLMCVDHYCPNIVNLDAPKIFQIF